MNMIAGVYPIDAGTITLDGMNISRLSEPARAKYLGRVFQDPMMGTAADMQIIENLAMAKRRGKTRTLAWGVTRAEKDEYTDRLRELGLGLEKRLTSKVGSALGRPAPGAHAPHGNAFQSPNFCCSTSTRPRSIPKRRRKVLNLTEQIVGEHQLTTLMVTHNMNDAIRLGNRLIMMHEGRIIYDVQGEEKAALTVADLLQKFEEVSGGELANDRMLLN